MDYCIRYIDLPYTIKGVTVMCDGFFNIYINSKLSIEEQKKAVAHELCHVMRDDFFNDTVPLETIETFDKIRKL